MTRSTLRLDSHVDIPWPDYSDPFSDGPRCVDVPKMQAGGLTAACFVAFVPQTACDAENAQAAFDRAAAMLTAIRGMERPSAPAVQITPRASQITQAVAQGAIAVIPVIENGHALGQRTESVAHFAALGVRYLTLTHNGHNDLADSAIPRRDLGDAEMRHGGLSGFGREVIAALNAHGILVDASHASKAAMMQATEVSRTPVIASHSCVRGLCDHPRNLDDEQLDRLQATGGLIQITAMPYFLRRGGRPAEVGVKELVDHIDYAVRRIGLDHVGISSDFDGGGGIVGWMNARETPNVTRELAARGYNEAQIAALWGGNFLRVLTEAETAAGGH